MKGISTGQQEGNDSLGSGTSRAKTWIIRNLYNTDSDCLDGFTHGLCDLVRIHPENENTYPTGLLVATWAHTNKEPKTTNTQQLLLNRGVALELHFVGEPASCTFQPAEPALLKAFLESYFNQQD